MLINSAELKAMRGGLDRLRKHKDMKLIKGLPIKL